MSWNAPVDRVPGELITAAIWNRDQDNFRFLREEYNLGMHRNSNQAIGSGADDNIDWDVEEYDNSFAHDVSTNPDEWTYPVAGLYLITGQISWAADSTGRRQVKLNTGAAVLVRELSFAAPPSTGTFIQPVACMEKVSAATVREVAVFQDTGGDLNLQSGVTGTALQVALLYQD